MSRRPDSPDVLIELLQQAHARLDTLPPRWRTRVEETTAGTCWELADVLDNQLHGMVA